MAARTSCTSTSVVCAIGSCCLGLRFSNRCIPKPRRDIGALSDEALSREILNTVAELLRSSWESHSPTIPGAFPGADSR
jgi:hypothetical protein